MNISRSLVIFFFILQLPIITAFSDNQVTPNWQNYQDSQSSSSTIFVRNILDHQDLNDADSAISKQAITNQAKTPKIINTFFIPKDPTPSRIFNANLSMPNYFETSNNLAKKPGSFYRAYGEVIFIQGKITDSFNVPISGAVVEIWQTNAAGKYHSLLEPNSEYVDKNFSMSGRAITDNLGNYYFITIMPGSYLNRAPHINMNIYHQKFGKLETEFYFENHPLNQNDYQYLSYNKKEREMLTAKVRLSDITNSKSIKICTFNIVMTGTHDYKSFGWKL